MPYRIAIVDDNAELLDHLSSELRTFEDLNIVFVAKNGADYVDQVKYLAPDKRPEVVIMDLDMPVMNGIDAVRAGTALYEDIAYIMFTVSDDSDKLFDAITAGAGGYLLKDEPAAAVFNAIKEVIDKSGAPMSPSIARKTLKLLSQQPADHTVRPMEGTLSDREMEILKHIVAGLNYKQIAERIFLSPFTVRNHISKIYSKLQITSKAHAIKIAMTNKWV